MKERRSRSARWALILVTLTAVLAAGWWWRGQSADRRARDKQPRNGPLVGPRWQLIAASASIAGQVADVENRAIAKAQVCAHAASYASRAARAGVCVLSDAQGAYQLHELAPQAYTITASAPGFVASAAGDGAPLVLRSAETRSGVDVHLRAGEANLRGTVVDATGGPVPDAEVRAERTVRPRLVLDARSDDLGNFAFALPEGAIALQASAAGYSTASETRVVPSSDVRLVLVPGASLRGRVLARESGLPLSGIELRAEPNGAQPAPSREYPHSDAHGAFTIDGLEPGSYFVVAAGPGLRGRSVTPFELALGEVIDGIELSVREVARVSGHVLQSDGQGCARGSLQLGAPDPLHPVVEGSDHFAAGMQGPPLIAEIGADGSVEFAAVEPGKYYVTLRCDGQMLVDGPRVLEVGAEDVSGLSWTVATGASLRVFTVDERDQPVGGVEFTVQLPSLRAWADHSLTARTDARDATRSRACSHRARIACWRPRATTARSRSRWRCARSKRTSRS